jgi:hypothetical protein
MQRCDIDGINVVISIAEGEGTHTPKQLVTAESSRELYCCDREGMRVLRFDLDRKSIETLVQNGVAEKADHSMNCLRWFVGIKVDDDAVRIYWTQKGSPESGKGKIPRCSINGAGTNSEAWVGQASRAYRLIYRSARRFAVLTDRGEYVVLHLADMVLTQRRIPLGNTVKWTKIPTEGEDTSHEILFRKLHGRHRP